MNLTSLSLLESLPFSLLFSSRCVLPSSLNPFALVHAPYRSPEPVIPMALTDLLHRCTGRRRRRPSRPLPRRRTSPLPPLLPPLRPQIRFRTRPAQSPPRVLPAGLPRAVESDDQSDVYWAPRRRTAEPDDGRHSLSPRRLPVGRVRRNLQLAGFTGGVHARRFCRP